MRTVPTGRATETVEVYDVTDCPGCGRPLRAPNVLVAHLPCSCAGPHGHRVRTCRACGTAVYEPEHQADAEVITGRWAQ